MNKLFEKSYIGKMKLKNRIVMGPMGTTGEADGAYNIDAINYFTERAKGGTGLIITGANVVSTKYEPRPCTELSNFHHVERLNMLVERCHNYGAKVCVQVSPGLGRQQFTDPFTPPYSASDCGAFWFPDLKCKPFTKEDIKYIVEKVGYGASLAKMAGADAVELHAYGGYLLDQFHSKQWNTRTDEYGGSLENRMRFTLECIAAIRANVGSDFPILVKFTPVHKVAGFREIDEGIAMAKILEGAGIEALHVDVGCYEAWYKAISTVYNEEGHQLDVVKAIKENVSLPVLGQGKLFDPKKAQEVVEQGVLDYVVLGHQMLADPYWANKVKQGNTMDIAPCVGCNECLLAGFSGKHYYCAVNPLCYAEKEFALPKVDGTKKSVLVIGGGPGGMYAAITARKRGYEVDLYEKEERLGGTLWAAGMPTFKHDVLKLITYLERQCLKTGVNVYLNREFTLKDAKKDYDKVILSAGSSPLMPPIPGIEKAGFVSEFLTDRKEAGKQIVIIGGGLAGCEAACYLKENAERVTILEMQEDILFGCDHCLNNDQALRQMLQDNSINKITKATVIKIEDNQVTYLQDNQEYTIVCDTIINAAGFKPNDQLEDALEEIYDDVTVIGDAKAPRKILTAIHEGYHAIRVME